MYLAIGGLSLLKAFAVRGDKKRFRSELTDAALFIGVGLLLQRAKKRRSKKTKNVDEIAKQLGKQFAGGDSGSRSDRKGRSKSLPERLTGR